MDEVQAGDSQEKASYQQLAEWARKGLALPDVKEGSYFLHDHGEYVECCFDGLILAGKEGGGKKALEKRSFHSTVTILNNETGISISDFQCLSSAHLICKSATKIADLLEKGLSPEQILDFVQEKRRAQSSCS